MDFAKFCATCPRDTHCCTFPHEAGMTFVGLEDAQSIAHATGLQYSEFLDFSPLSKEVVDILKEEDPLLEGGMRFQQLDQEHRLLRLQKNKNEDCIFFEDGKCGIYDVRPKVCRMYPFWGIRLLNKKVKIVSHDIEHTCPIVVSFDATDMESALAPSMVQKLISLFEDIEQEDKAYQKGIKEFSTLLKK